MIEPRFGAALRPDFFLEPGHAFLNHGSFGALPRSVADAQAHWREEMERRPDQFFRHRLQPALRESAAHVAPFFGCRGEDIAFVENATTGISTVLQRFAFRAGDEILITGTTYNAVRLAVEDVCRRTGARVRTAALPLPFTSDDDIVARIAGAAGSNVRLAIVDHIVSPTGFVLPAAAITRALKAKGVAVLIDGAHAPGHVALDIPALGADWYTGNLHKWFFAPRGTAILWATPDARAMTIPLNVSHFVHDGFPRSFDYTGTRDATAWAAARAAADFVEHHGLERIMAFYKAQSVAGGLLFARIGAEALAGPSNFCAMRSYRLPQSRAAVPEDAAQVMADLWEKARVQVASSAVGDVLVLRISAAIYATLDDMQACAAALDTIGWPARA